MIAHIRIATQSQFASFQNPQVQREVFSSSCFIIIGYPIVVKRNSDCDYRHTDKMDKKGRTAFGARLLAARKHAKMAQIPAAKAVGMSQGTLAELELDGQGSSYTAQLAAVYGVNPNWLATGKGRMLSDDAEQNSAPVVARDNASHSYVRASDIEELFSLFFQVDDEVRMRMLSSMRTLASRAGARAAGDRDAAGDDT